MSISNVLQFPMRSLDDAQKERSQLAAAYVVAKKKEREALYADPINGVRFKRFVATLNHFGPDDAARMIEYIRLQCEAWISYSSVDMHAAALEAIRNRIVRIRERAGLVPFDDPLPGQPDDVWQICKKVLEL